jgi:hypothetical protein
MSVPPKFESLQALHVMYRDVAAADYNLVRLALSRLDNPLHLDLGNRLPCLETWLCDDYWLCFDACRNDQPVLAWTAFARSQRGGLHQPVACHLNLYHMHAGLVMGEVFDAISAELRRKLDQLPA